MSGYGIDFYHPSLCQVCKTTSNLKTCGSCKSLYYCSQEHQKAHWPNHKILCKLLTKTDKVFTVDLENSVADRVGYMLMLKVNWCLNLNRCTTYYEESVLHFRRSCVICNIRNCNIRCESCLSVFYCSSKHERDHKETHEPFCKLLKLNLDIVLFNFKTKMPKTIFSAKCMQNNLRKLPENLIQLVYILRTENILMFERELKYLEYYSIVDSFAPMANIIFGLEKGNLLKNRLFHKNNLVVHIVGANEEEGLWNWGFLMEFIIHWIENLQNITLVVIGPRAVESKIYEKFCYMCRKKKVITEYVYAPFRYHHVMKKLDKPDLIVGFNCGFCCIPSWIESIPSLTKYEGVPLLFTDGTKDWINADLEVLKNNTNNKIQVLVQPQRNPFSNLSPMKKLEHFKNDPICYSNGYIAVVVTK